MKEKDVNQKYYENNAQNFITSTIECNMENQYKKFLKYLNEGSKILDVRFGIGRDILYFKK